MKYNYGFKSYGGSKYGNFKTRIDGITFDSEGEAQRYLDLKMLEKAGVISELELQKSFVLIPAQRRNGKVVERECRYRADFYYFDNVKKEYVCEDFKGFKTKDYVIKRKLMLFKYGIQVKEIGK